MKLRAKVIVIGSIAGLAACVSTSPTQREEAGTVQKTHSYSATSSNSENLNSQQPAGNQQVAGSLGQVQSSPGQSQVQVSRNIPVVNQSKSIADVNRMSSEDFMSLGLSKDQADRIVDYRNSHGSFKSVDDLSSVPSIDSNWLSQNKNRIGVSTQQG